MNLDERKKRERKKEKADQQSITEGMERTNEREKKKSISMSTGRSTN